MIPTLFGVTIVSFCIMQLAPGDPLLNKLSSSGAVGQSSQTREAFLIQKRDLKLDKPLVLNFNYFKDFSDDLRIAAHYRSLTLDEIAAELIQLADHEDDVEDAASRLRFLRALGIDKFQERLHPPDLTPEQLEASSLTSEQWTKEKEERRLDLARAVQGFLQVWCEDRGSYAAPAAVEILHAEDLDSRLKVGAIRCLASMVINPFVYTYSRNPTEDENEAVVSSWSRLWERDKAKYPPIDPGRRTVLQQQLKKLAASSSRTEMFGALEDFDVSDAPFFADVLLGEAALNEKVIAAEFLSLYTTTRIQLDVTPAAPAEEIAQVARNWIAHFEGRNAEYHVPLHRKLWYIIADTQYAHMVWRLATFDFGRSALKTKDPVGQKIWDAVWVSAPLMLMAQLFIYLASVPLGIVCAVERGRWLDRVISFVLYILYSIPPFVAGMMFLLFLCYGDYLKWFPMERLHSDNAGQMSTGAFLLDYLWHCVLPVTCLALFSLAAMAMYSRTAMLDVLGQDYIRTARAKGLTGRKVVMKHGARNGMIPIITLFSNFLPAMLGGSVLIEYIFNIPGMGRLSWASIEQKDFPTLMALIYVDAIVVMLSILLTDLLYVVVDPRISFDSQGGDA